MSRIGKQPIPVPKGVDISISGEVVNVKGPKGQLQVNSTGWFARCWQTLPPGFPRAGPNSSKSSASATAPKLGARA
jgi:hypothetical protein